MPTAADTELISAIRAALRRAADPTRAPQMQAYMKSVLPYLGVPVPDVRRLTRAASRARPFGEQRDLEATVRNLWAQATAREERYAATALLDVPSARTVRGPELISLCGDLITEGAWWDHVDEIAHRVGELLAGWPETVRPVIRAWTRAEDHWLRRAAIICQLGCKQATDTDLLTEAIDANATEPDFFLRKAIGWALRDYARTDPAWVQSFVATHALSPLSRREALKRL